VVKSRQPSAIRRSLMAKGLRMVDVTMVKEGKVRGRIHKRASCRGSTADPHACL
jgi:hypothetical protein